LLSYICKLKSLGILMGRNIIRANAREVTARGKADKSDFSASPDIDNTGRGITKLRNTAWEINDKYAGAGDLNVQRLENGGLTNIEVQRSIYSANQAIYHPTTSVNEAMFARPASWGSSVNIMMPAGYTAGKTITGNDGQQYIEMRDSVTGEVVSHLGNSMCMSVDSDVFNPLKATTKSLRDEADHFEINYKFDADGKAIPRTESEKAFREMMVDLDNGATKLPSQLNMITIITNDALAASNPKFQSAAKTAIETPVTPVENFSGAASAQTTPVQSVVFKTGSNKPAPWAMPAVQNDGPKLEPQL
jgi:hypothetical protein